MLKLLLKIRIQAWIAYLSGTGRTGGKTGIKPGKGKIVLFAILYVYLIAVFIGMFFAMFSALAGSFAALGLGWFYFSFFVMTAFVMMFIFSVFTAKAQLFEAKDNELLLSMPIPPSAVMASRMASLLLINLGFELLVAIPAAAAWCIACPVSIGGAVAFVLICVVLPFFSLSISALFGWLLSILTARVRRKSLVSTLACLVFLAVYFWVYSNINTILTGLVSNAENIARSLSGALPLVWLGKAAAEGDMLCLAGGIVCLVVPFVIVYAVLAKTFVRTATMKRGTAKLRYVRRDTEKKSPFSALFRREAARLLSSSTYIMNSAIGSVMSIVFAAALVLKGRELISALGGAGLENVICAVLLLILCALGSMTTISACSVSLEGKHIWIVRSMPVDASSVLRAKLALHLLVSAPGLAIAQIVSIAVARPTGLMILWMIVLPQIYNLLLALFGQWANLNHPKLEWQNEAQPVKQGISVLISMFGGMAMLLLPAIAGVLLRNVPMGLHIVAAAALVIFAMIAALLNKWCMSKGVEIFNSL